uniref:Crinkler effector protein N-terminal domain-containing protein n=1 Tax=Rhizophagus irregularis (strain DAOM 181602 / DAOM 197198 / MUCL 43194) TaxID=747089 RepID=U9T918_RHIID
MTVSAFAVDIDRESYIPVKDIKLWKVTIPGDQDDQLRNLILQDSDELLAINDIGDYWPTSPPKKHIHVIVKLPLLSLEEALSCIPPPITYSPDCTTSKTTTKVNGDPPTSVQLWGDFFDKVNQFKRPQLIPDNEEDVRVANDINICMVLNRLLRLEYKFARCSSNTTGAPDFTCHYIVELLILVVKVKRKHVLEDIGEQTFSEFYKTKNGDLTNLQLYGGKINVDTVFLLFMIITGSYAVNIQAKLWISKTLPLQSESPPVLKAYAYLTRQAKENPKSPKPQVVVPVQGDNDSRTLRSHSKSSSNSSLNQQQSSSTFANQQSSSNTSVKQNNYSFSDFKFKSILGEGRSGKTLLCEFRGDMIALKSADLSKAPSYVLEEMQKEVEIYKDLADIQGKYIPKLVCYGYYGGGMSFVISLTIVGTMLSDQKIMKRQRSRAIKELEAIYKRESLIAKLLVENAKFRKKFAEIEGDENTGLKDKNAETRLLKRIPGVM